MGDDVFCLGILFGNETEGQEEEVDIYYFPHLMLQEFAAAKFLSKADKVNMLLLLVRLHRIRHRCPEVCLEIAIKIYEMDIYKM